jgi:FSR family fosmidomycin resistance protein-like MFS transporter
MNSEIAVSKSLRVRYLTTFFGIPAAVWVLAFAHGLVDCHATFVQPLWPSLAHLLQVDDGRMQWTYMAWSLSGSITQFGFAYLADAGYGRRLLWVGPLIGIVLMGIIGQSHGLLALTFLVSLANLGFAAFHPEAATLAGAAAPHDRARAMSIFAVGGYLGQAIGPPLSGSLVSHGSLSALTQTIIPGLGLCLLLIVALKCSGPIEIVYSGGDGAKQKSPGLRQVLRGREWPVAHLVTLSILRVSAAMGVPITLAYGLDDLGVTAETIGEIQSFFLIGMGAGTFACALLVKNRNENAVMWLAPLMVALLLPLTPAIHHNHLWLLMLICGLLLGLSLPILTSRGQQLLPEAPRIGSSLTMGVTWGLGGILVGLLMAAVNSLENHFLAFYVLAVWAAMSACMSWPGWDLRKRNTA